MGSYRVPDLQLDALSVDLHDEGSEVYADGRLVLLLQVSPHYLVHERALPDGCEALAQGAYRCRR